MKPRIYVFTLLFLALVAFTPALVKADTKSPQSDNHDTKKEKNISDRNLPINTAIVALFIAGGGIGVIAMKKASVASRTF